MSHTERKAERRELAEMAEAMREAGKPLPDILDALGVTRTRYFKALAELKRERNLARPDAPVDPLLN